MEGSDKYTVIELLLKPRLGFERGFGKNRNAILCNTGIYIPAVFSGGKKLFQN
jgi:hypothetical protein